MARGEFCVLPGSSLVGKKLEEIEREYGIRVDHIHDQILTRDTREPRDPDRIINEANIIKVEGKWKDVGRIGRDSVGIIESD